MVKETVLGKDNGIFLCFVQEAAVKALADFLISLGSIKSLMPSAICLILDSNNEPIFFGNLCYCLVRALLYPLSVLSGMTILSSIIFGLLIMNG